MGFADGIAPGFALADFGQGGLGEAGHPHAGGGHQVAVVVRQRAAAAEAEDVLLAVLREVQPDVLVGEVEGEFGRFGIGGVVPEEAGAGRPARPEEAGVAVDVQAVPGAGDADVELAPGVVVRRRFVPQQHVHGVEFPPLGLVDGRDEDGPLAAAAEIFQPGLEGEFPQIAPVADLLDAFELPEELADGVDAGAVGVARKGFLLGFFPCVGADGGRRGLPVDAPEEIAHFGQVGEPESVHRLDEPRGNAGPRQGARRLRGLVVGADEDAGGFAAPGAFHLFDEGQHHLRGGVPDDFHLPGFVADGDARTALHPVADGLDEGVGEFDDGAGAAVVFDQLVAAFRPAAGERGHVAAVGAAEGVDVLVVVAHGDHAHFLVGPHQGPHQGVLAGVHVLRLVDDQHRLGDAVRLHPAAFDQPDGLADHVPGLFQVADASQEVEAVGVEGLDFDEVGGVADEVEQAALEFGGGGAREGQHEQLLVLDVFEQQQGRELVDQDAGLAAAGAGGDDDARRPLVADDGPLGGRERAEELLVLARGDVPVDFRQAIALEVLGDELAEIHLEVVPHVPQGGGVVLHHQVGVFADDVDLPDLLLVELVEHPVVLDLVPVFHVGETVDFHGVVDDQEAALQLHGADFREVEQRVLDFVDAEGAALGEQRAFPPRGEFLQQLRDRELDRHRPDDAAGTGRGAGRRVEFVDGEAADFDAAGLLPEGPLRIQRRHHAEPPRSGVFLLADDGFDGQEVEERADVFHRTAGDAAFEGPLVEGLEGQVGLLPGDLAEQEALERGEAFQGPGGGGLRAVDPGGQVARVGEDAFLTHAGDGADDGGLAQPEDVGEVVHPRIGFPVLPRPGDLLARNQRLDDPDGVLPPPVVEQGRFRDAAARLVHVPDHDAGGEDVRDVVAAAHVAGLLQGGDGGPHAGLDVRHLVVPARLPRDFEGAAGHLRALAGEGLDGAPDLLDFAQAQLGLVEQDEVLVQVLVAVEHVALGGGLRVAAGTAGLLDVVFERVGDVVVHHQAHVLLVHAHAEGGRGDDGADFVEDEGVLVRDLLGGVHLAVERQRGDAVPRQLVREVARPLRARDVHDGRASAAEQQAAQVPVLLLLGVRVDDRILQVFPGGGRREEPQVQPQLRPEVVADVGDHLLLRRRREARDGNRRTLPLLLPQLADEVADVEVIDAEILPPRGKTVRLVDDEPHHVAREQQLLDRLRPQHFRRDVQQRRRSVRHPPDRLRAAQRVEQAVDGDRFRDAPRRQVVHLVLHQRLQGRNDHRQAVHRPPLHERRQLEGERLAAARRENGQQRLAVHRRLHRPLLHGLAVEEAEGVVAEDAPQPLVDVQLVAAVRAPFPAGRAAQGLQDMLHARELVQHPRRRRGTPVARVDQRQRVGQFARHGVREPRQVRVGADPPREGFFDEIRGIPTAWRHPQEGEKPAELLEGRQQRAENRLQLPRQRPECIHLVEEKVPRLLRVVERIVQLLGLQLVVLQQPVVGPFREQEGRKIQRVDGRFAADSRNGTRQVLQIVVHDVVPAEEPGAGREPRELRRRSRVQLPVRPLARPVIMDPPVRHPDFDIDERDLVEPPAAVPAQRLVALHFHVAPVHSPQEATRRARPPSTPFAPLSPWGQVDLGKEECRSAGGPPAFLSQIDRIPSLSPPFRPTPKAPWFSMVVRMHGIMEKTRGFP